MKYFAFLRAINVTNRFVKMDRLRTIFEEMGFDNVDTYIQSGNVFFHSQSNEVNMLRNQIESSLEENLGFEVPTFIRTMDELRDLQQQEPFNQIEHGKNPSYYVSFTYDQFSSELREKIDQLYTDTNHFQAYKNHLFWLYRRDRGKSSYSNSYLERKLKVPLTRRNMNTINKIVKKYID